MMFLAGLKRLFIMKAMLSILFLGSNSFAHATDYHVVGSAYSLKTGALLYREAYQKINDALHEVEYSEPDGTVFGRKTIDFSQSLIVPSFSQSNDRNGEEIYVRQEGGNVVVNYKGNTTSKQKSERLELGVNMVADAGFDGFIKQYWSVLVSGETLDVEYLVPSRQTTFRFRFSRALCIDGTNNDAICFSLSPLSWAVKLAVDPIIVAYDTTEKTLLRFTGRGNIASAKGKYEIVDIQYRYF